MSDTRSAARRWTTIDFLRADFAAVLVHLARSGRRWPYRGPLNRPGREGWLAGEELSSLCLLMFVPAGACGSVVEDMFKGAENRRLAQRLSLFE